MNQIASISRPNDCWAAIANNHKLKQSDILCGVETKRENRIVGEKNQPIIIYPIHLSTLKSQIQPASILNTGHTCLKKTRQEKDDFDRREFPIAHDNIKVNISQGQYMIKIKTLAEFRKINEGQYMIKKIKVWMPWKWKVE